jgi:hypothetical protein
MIPDLHLAKGYVLLSIFKISIYEKFANIVVDIEIFIFITNIHEIFLVSIGFLDF